MKIRVENSCLFLDDEAVRYNSSCISINDMMQIVSGWRRRLASVVESGGVVYLPFSIDEDHIEAFEAVLDGSRLRLRVVKLAGSGFVPGVDDVMTEICRDSAVVERYTRELLTCGNAAMLSALDELDELLRVQ